MSSFFTHTSARRFSSFGTSVIRMVPGLATVPMVWVARSLTIAVLRRAQLEVVVPVLLLGEFLVRLFELRGDIHALGLQLPPVIRGDLRDLLFLLRDGGARPRRSPLSCARRSCSFSMRSRCLSVNMSLPAKPSF